MIGQIDVLEKTDAPVEDASIQERKVQLADAIGVTAERMGSVALDIQRMRELGVLVDIDICGLSLLSILVSWAELGVPTGDVRRKRLRRGRKDLFPEHAKKFRSLETRLRASLEKHSFILEGFRPYRWVPFTAYESWKEAWGQLQAEWKAVLDDLLDHYDEMVQEEASVAAQIAAEAWDALVARYKARHSDKEEPVIVIGEREFSEQVPAEFVRYVQRRALDQLPTKEALRNGLYVDYRTALVLDGADLEAERLCQEQLKTAWQQEQIKQAQARAEQQAIQQQMWAEERKARLEVEAHEKKLQAMHQAELAHARQQLQGIVSPFKETFDQLRAQMYADTSEIAASIQKHGYLHGKVAERARNLFDTFSLLNAHGDNELEAALKELRQSLNKRPAEEGQKATYDLAAIQTQLRAIEDMTHKAARQVAERAAAPTRARALEL